VSNIKSTKTIREVNLYCSACGNPLDAYHTDEIITNLDTGKTAHIEMIEGTCRQSKSACLMSNQTLGPDAWMNSVKLSNYDGSPAVRFNVYSGNPVELEVA
jgi:hypothetical protein